MDADRAAARARFLHWLCALSWLGRMLSRRQKRAIVGTAGFGLLAAVILFSIGRYFASRALERQLAEERTTLKPPEPLIVTVVRDSVERRRSFAARAEPWTQATVAPEVGGTVARIAAEVGMRVAAGAELLALDDTVARATAEAARIQAAEAARRQKEIDQLVRTQASASTEGAAAAAAAGAAAKEAERAAVLLERHRLRAPFAGQVQARRADVGDYLNPGQPAFELVDTARLRIVFFAGESEIASFTPDTAVEVTLPGQGAEAGRARVRHVAPAAGPNGLFRIEAELDNPQTRIPGGVAATVTAAVKLYRETLFIPTAAVRLEGARALVHRVGANGAADAVSIEIGPEIDGRFPVLGGLRAGDRLLVR